VKIHRNSRGLKNSVRLPSEKYIQRVVNRVFSSERTTREGELNIVFVDNKILRDLSRTFLGKDHHTDVIAFPYGNFPLSVFDQPFGDIYISVPMARKNASLYNQSVQKELTRLIVHGVLHLLGYSDGKTKDKARLWARQERLLNHL